MKTAALVLLCAAALMVGWHFYDASRPEAKLIEADRAKIAACKEKLLALSGASLSMQANRCARLRDAFIAQWRRDP